MTNLKLLFKMHTFNKVYQILYLWLPIVMQFVWRWKLISQIILLICKMKNDLILTDVKFNDSKALLNLPWKCYRLKKKTEDLCRWGKKGKMLLVKKIRKYAFLLLCIVSSAIFCDNLILFQVTFLLFLSLLKFSNTSNTWEETVKMVRRLKI